MGAGLTPATEYCGAGGNGGLYAGLDGFGRDRVHPECPGVCPVPGSDRMRCTRNGADGGVACATPEKGLSHPGGGVVIAALPGPHSDGEAPRAWNLGRLVGISRVRWRGPDTALPCRIRLRAFLAQGTAAPEARLYPLSPRDPAHRLRSREARKACRISREGVVPVEGGRFGSGARSCQETAGYALAGNPVLKQEFVEDLDSLACVHQFEELLLCGERNRQDLGQP